MSHDPLMLFGGKAVCHAGNIVSYDALWFGAHPLLTKPVKAIDMRLGHLQRISHIGREQITNYLLRRLRGLHDLRVVVEVLTQKTF